jgi:hypothetical protein
MKVIFGNAVQDARGKLNGNVYSKNRFGAYVRTKVTPVNRNTSYQTAVRAALSSNSTNWGQLLTAGERAEWNAFAFSHPFTNIFGESKKLTGHQMYTGIQSRLSNIAGTPTTTPPADITTGTIGGLTLVATVAAGGTLTIATNEANVPVGAVIAVYATPVMPNGRNFVKTELRYIGNFASGASPYNIKADWIAKYGTFPSVATGKIFVMVQIITVEGWGSLPAGTSQYLS